MHRCSKASSLCLTLTQTRTQTQTLILTLSSTLSLNLTLTITLTLTLEGELATLLGDHGAGDAGVALAQQPTPSRRRRPPPRDQHCYATLLSHSSFLPGTLALLHSLRAGGALLPATVLATPSALLPGATALLERFARVRLLSAAVERATAPSAKALDMMRRKPSECEGGRAHARNETGMASAQDCSQWQRLSTYVKLRLFAPNATGCGVLLYLDADCLVRGNLDPVFTAFPYALTGSVRLSSAGNPGYWNSGVMLLRPSRAAYLELVRMARDGDYALSDDPGDQDVLIGWAQRHPQRWRPLPGKLNMRISHPGSRERYNAMSEPKVLHFCHHPKPWLAWFGPRAPAAKRAAGSLLDTWPPITWGMNVNGVRHRMSTREQAWSLLRWKGAWNAYRRGLQRLQTSVSTRRCGDGRCEAPETSTSCGADCPAVSTPAQCGEEPHSDPGGHAVVWGASHKVGPLTLTLALALALALALILSLILSLTLTLTLTLSLALTRC